MGRHGEPVRRHANPLLVPAPRSLAPQTSDEFDGRALGPQWQWHANHRDDWYSLAARPGWLRLFPQPAASSVIEQPNLLLQKFPARSFSVETTLELLPMQSGEEAGVVVTGATQAMLGLRHSGSANQILLRTDDQVEVLAEARSNSIRLRVTVEAGGRCAFGYGERGEFIALPHSFQAQKGLWIGAKVGLYSLKQVKHAPAGHVDVDYFRFA
jgi:beta-xylosidase